MQWALGEYCNGNVSLKGQTLQAQSDRWEMKVGWQRYKTGVIIPELYNLAGGLPQQIEEDVQGGGGRGWGTDFGTRIGFGSYLFLQPTSFAVPLCVGKVGVVAPLNLERLVGRGSKTRLWAKEARPGWGRPVNQFLYQCNFWRLSYLKLNHYNLHCEVCRIQALSSHFPALLCLTAHNRESWHSTFSPLYNVLHTTKAKNWQIFFCKIRAKFPKWWRGRGCLGIFHIFVLSLF